MTGRRFSFVVSLTISLALLISACGGDATPTPTQAPVPTAAPAPAATPRPAAAAAPAATPAPTATPLPGKYGGVIEYWNRTDPPGFDLHRWGSHTPFFANPVFSTLVRFDPAKREFVPDNIIADLAASWEVSRDGLTYTFFLQEGVTWHDGQPFTAADVVYTFEKMTDSERSVIASRFPAFDRAEAVGSNTVKIHLNSPQASLLSMLAQGYAVIQAEHLADIDPKTPEFMVGTGPFMLKEYVSGVSYTYEKNPNYFKKGLPYLDGIILHVIRDRPAQMAAFVAGRIDMTSPTLGMPTKSIYDDHVSKAPNGNFQILSHPLVRMLWFNLNGDNPWNDVKVRRAMNLVLEREQITLAAVGDLGWGRIAGLMPPESPYALPQDELAKLLMWDKPYEERVAEAKRLMAEAGYADGFEMRLLARNLSIYKRILTQVSDLLQQHLSIKTTIDLPETARAMELRSARDYDMYLEVMYSNIFDPDEIMSYWVTGGSENWTGYSNPKIDELFTKQSEAGTMAQRTEFTHEIERILAKDSPALSTFFLQYGIGVYPQVKNYVPANTVYSVHLQMEQVWLER